MAFHDNFEENEQPSNKIFLELFEFLLHNKSLLKYTQHNIQQELISLIAKQMRRNLLPASNEFYSIIKDETSFKHKVSICLRWSDSIYAYMNILLAFMLFHPRHLSLLNRFYLI